MAYTIAALEAALPPPAMDRLVDELLASSLLSLGLFSNGIHRIADLGLSTPPAPYYERWLSGSTRYLQQRNVLADDLTPNQKVRALADLWADWEARRLVWESSPNQQAQHTLLELCLKALPGILSGTQRATDVLFPNASTQLVKNVFQGSALADHFSEVLGETLTSCIDNHLQSDPQHRIRILEIGAGTGSTTAKLLPALERYPVAEYCYTDVSQTFLMHAEKHFQPRCPVLTTAIFDVSKPPAAQSIAAGHYDFAIAANVFHATADIRETLRNAKAVLKNQGVLLLNEISAWSLSDHLTLGLLEEWWLHEDTTVRIPGSPGLAPEKWRAILADEGFESIVFPAEDAHRFGQQIVAAVSDGWTRQRLVTIDPPPPAAAVDRAVDTRPPAELPTGMGRDYIRKVITETLSEAVRMDVASIRPDASFADYGVESIIGVNLVRSISEALQIELETTSLFEYSTVDQLTEYILANWQQQIPPQPARVQEISQKASPSTDKSPALVDPSTFHRFVSDQPAVDRRGVDPIAIIGMSGRFADSESLDAFWDNLAHGRDLVKQVVRWSTTDCAMSDSPGRAYCSRGSFIDSIDQFDPAFFGITSQEATYMDPQQRLFLEESWRALEDAGYASKSVHEKQCGVYVGCGSSKYDRLFPGDPPPQAFWGNSESVTPARIAYYLNLQGPAVAVDTACSASLVAIHLACQGLWSRETEMALAGGVFLQPTAQFYQVANRAGMLSPDGKCYSFDARANGFVPGEGVGVVVLKRLRDALEDGDCIHGVIAGSGINQDGKSNGLIAPNGRAQERLARSVYDRFNINPETIQVVEAHGTATLMGDSVEYNAITRAFREYTSKTQFCALGTVKTNIGHAATAAGVAGVLKVLLALRHRQIPPSLHFQTASPSIPWESGPFYVNTQLKDWAVPDEERRRAAISSFGFSGTNAHLVIEEAPSIERSTIESPGYLIVLSARTSEQLQQQAHNLLMFLERVPGLSMNDLSFSLFTGRTHLAHRLSCIARTQDELIRRLRSWTETGSANQIQTSETQEGNRREHVSLKKFGNHCIQECAATTTAATYLEHLDVIADLYVQGYALDFEALFAPGSRRLPLPTYPFARERYWIDTVSAPRRARRAATAVARRPVVHTKPSPPARQTHGATVNSAGEGLRPWLQQGLSHIAADLLAIDIGEVSPNIVLLDLGFDSVGLTTFANAINGTYSLDLTPVLFFDHPTIGDIAKHLSVEPRHELLRLYRGDAPTIHEPTPLPAAQPELDIECAEDSGQGCSADRFVNEPIAIVGISGVMPQSADLDEFWEHLKNSKDLITVIPPERWRWEDFDGDPLTEPNKSSSRWGGFMKEIDKFDPLFFGISPREAEMMDPQQRIFLEHVWKAVEDSGHKLSDLSGTRTGVFVGVAANEYIEVLRSARISLDGYSVSGNSHSVLANRVSFLLNLRGPSEPVDTACSASLVALHRAIESIHTGSSAMAIVGGVQILLSPAAYISFSSAGMLSRDGKCKTFDKRANGYVRGEGCGVMFLKPLAAAEADGNHIYAVIRATAENHGGRVTTMTAPNSVAQSALLVEAYETAQIDPATVGYIECHGTGTSLGDPVEIQGLSTAFAELYRRHNKPPTETPHCGLSAIKSNIGHLETAAGIAGVLKVLLAIKHQQIPASINFEDINPYINLKGTPFFIADTLTPWQAAAGEDGTPLPRRAGVSSFGFGGANAHVVLEEYLPPPRQSLADAAGPQLIVLSARNADRLKAYVASMHAYLETSEVDLSDFAYTLQVGRDEMPERLAVVASSLADVRQKLAGFLAGGKRSTDVYHNNTRKREVRSAGTTGADDEALVQALLEQNDLSRLAELWVSGKSIDWSALFRAARPRRLSLPTYPFARERCWPSAADSDGSEPRSQHEPTAAAVLHPLVHRNVSTFDEQKFASRFSGDEFYFADHVVGTQRILPGAAYLEMARAAGELAGDAHVGVIRNVIWQRPLSVGPDGDEFEISLVRGKDDVAFTVRTARKEHPVVHCTGKVSYSTFEAIAPEVLDIAGIRDRCAEQVLTGEEIYSFLGTAGLKLGRSFQTVRGVYASQSEALAIVHLPDHLKQAADQFVLHPALMDGAFQAGFGLVRKAGVDLPLSIPFSVGEVQVLHPLHDLCYGYATWAGERPTDGRSHIKVDLHLLDNSGRVLVRIKDFVSRPVQREATHARPREGVKATLQSAVPAWTPMHIEKSDRIVLPESAKVLLLGSGRRQQEWVRQSYPNTDVLDLGSLSSVESIAEQLGDRAFDQLLWIAPDVCPEPGDEIKDADLIANQEAGVLAVFRIIKALLQLGHAQKPLQWTLVIRRTQQVTKRERIQPAHAGMVGLIGCLAKEHPRWKLRLLDVDSLASVAAEECLSLPWDKHANALAHRRGEWFHQVLTPIDTLPPAIPVYRRNGVYVVIGGAGGIGDVWSRFMIERYQANVVWVGRRQYDTAIGDKIVELSRLGPAPLYISADAKNLEELAQAREAILRTHPAIHGVVHSAVVLQDQTIARMDEAAFRVGLSAKVDISANLDRVFGAEELDFMLFFSSVVSFLKPPGQCNYSAGCTFKDSFARKLQQERAYPVKVMNWGYWGSVGVAADESYNQMMARLGIGSIEPPEGMASLQVFVDSDVPQIALMKTLSNEARPGAASSVASSPAPTETEHQSGQEPLAAASTELTEQSYIDYLRETITNKLSTALKIDVAQIPSDEPLTEYGVDSIIGVNLVRELSEALQIEDELEPTSLFEYSTVDQLAQYILKQWPNRIAAHVAHVRGASAPVSARTEATPAVEDTRVPPSHEQANATPPDADAAAEQALATVLWEEASLDESYETLTF